MEIVKTPRFESAMMSFLLPCFPSPRIWHHPPRVRLDPPAMSLSVHEEVAIIDKDNNVIGKAERSVMRHFHLPHRATYIVTKNSKCVPGTRWLCDRFPQSLL
ncbi:hypothetical protein PINS_up005446 [Pythium insidiosum]|nr:hypothetical protein PINS_up005446 [Pythium insidiosum]